MLVNADNRGPLEVYHILKQAPVSWGPIIVSNNIRDTTTLYSKVTQHETALINSARLGGENVVMVNNLKDTLRSIGVEVGEHQCPSYVRRANYVEGPDNLGNEQDIEEPTEGLSQLHTSNKVILHEVYQVLQKRQQAPPVGGYLFLKNDHVKTKMKKLPPLPCKVCGSNNHWDKECPDWSIFLE
jgi:hypothetical protein